MAVAGAPAEAKRAKVTLAPSVWGPTIRGRISLGQLSLPLKATPGQIASGIRAGVMGYATVEKDRVFVATEVIAIHFRRHQFVPILSQDVAARAISIEGVVGHTFPIGKIVEFRPFLGARYHDIKADIGVIPANLAVAGHWAEPLLGSVAIIRPNRKRTLTAKIDRGFGGEKRRSFDIRGDVDVRFNRRISVFAGYRHMNQYYASGSVPFAIDLRGEGPILGLCGRF